MDAFQNTEFACLCQAAYALELSCGAHRHRACAAGQTPWLRRANFCSPDGARRTPRRRAAPQCAGAHFPSRLSTCSFRYSCSTSTQGRGRAG